MNRNEIVGRIRQLNPSQSLVILDLDSTLYDVSYRTEKILRDFSKNSSLRTDFPESCEVLKSIEVKSSDWGIKEALTRSDIRENLDFFDRVRRHWIKEFFSSRYLQFDKPSLGAVSFVQALEAQKIPIMYLTGRWQSTMEVGTLLSFETYNFPIPDGEMIRLFMKPDTVTRDDSFKLDIVGKEFKEYSNIILIDNEPLILKTIGESLEKVKCIYYKSVHSGRADVPTDILTLNNEFPELKF